MVTEDRLSQAGDGIPTASGMWRFNGAVSRSFDEHVRKSVPLYAEGHELVTRISEYFVGANSLVYEVGCSTGTLVGRLAQKHASKNALFVGIDVEHDMIDVAREKGRGVENLSFLAEDAIHFDYEKCDFIIAYYTVQFVRPKHRQLLINRLFEALNWGGALAMFEKVRAPDARFQDIATQIYTDYKSDEGYTSDEIITKSRSLKRVLEPFTTRANIEMLSRAGFKDMMSVMKYVNFEGFLAIK